MRAFPLGGAFEFPMDKENVLFSTPNYPISIIVALFNEQWQ